MAAQGRRDDAVHRAGLPLGEWIQRELQRQTPRRAVERRDLLHTEGGACADRAGAEALQHGATAQCAGLPTAGAGNHLAIKPDEQLR